MTTVSSPDKLTDHVRPLFEDPGKKIKCLANALFILGVVSGFFVLILAVKGGTNILLSLLMGAAVILGAYLQALFLTAFGELVESNLALKKSNDALVQLLTKDEQAPPEA